MSASGWSQWPVAAHANAATGLMQTVPCTGNYHQYCILLFGHHKMTKIGCASGYYVVDARISLLFSPPPQNQHLQTCRLYTMESDIFVWAEGFFSQERNVLKQVFDWRDLPGDTQTLHIHKRPARLNCFILVSTFSSVSITLLDIQTPRNRAVQGFLAVKYNISINVNTFCYPGNLK